MNVRSLIFFAMLAISQFVAGQTDGYVKNNEVNIYFRTFGEGKPILVINGGPGMNSNGFESLAKQLSKNNMIIIYDQRGTGKSTMSILDSTTITMELMIEDIECIRKQLKIEKLVVLGHSFGGMVASYYATIHPDNIESIILSSSGGVDLGLLAEGGILINSKLSKKELRDLEYWEDKINKGDTSYYAQYQKGLALAPAYLYNKKFVPLLAERLTQGNSTINLLLWKDLSKIGFNCVPQLEHFQKPVVIIQGKQDILKEETALNSHAAFKNSKLVMLDHCGHYGWLDVPEEYFSTIKTFLGSY